MEFEDRLVIWAEQIVQEARDGLKRYQETGRTQMSNAIDVAKTTKSLRVFRNWLRYQKARVEFWEVRDINGKDIAERINEVIAQIERQTSGDATMNAVTRFLGYFRRALLAMDHFKQIPPATEGGERR